jgi:hypothetical protein
LITSNGASSPTFPEGTAAERGFRFIVDWPAVAADDVAAIRAFRRREGALTDDAQMEPAWFVAG